MKKRISMFLLAVSVMAMTFTGCSNKDEVVNETVIEPTTQVETTVDDTETTLDDTETSTPAPGINIVDETTEAIDSEGLGVNTNDDAGDITEGGATTGVDEEKIAILDASTPVSDVITTFGNFAYPSVGETNEYMVKVYNSKAIGVNDYTGTSIYKTDDGNWVFIFYGNREGATKTIHFSFDLEETGADYTDDDINRIYDNAYLYRDMANAGEFLNPLDLDEDGNISFGEALFAAMIVWDSDIEYNGVITVQK